MGTQGDTARASTAPGGADFRLGFLVGIVPVGPPPRSVPLCPYDTTKCVWGQRGTPLQRLGRDPAWFTEPLTSVPASGPDTAAIAADARAWLLRDGRSTEPLLDVAALCEATGCRLRLETLRAAAGGLQGLLIPGGEGFHIVVDSEPPGGWGTLRGRLRRDVARHRIRFRVAHEVAHTLFFARTAQGAERRAPEQLGPRALL